ncbi:MAG: histidine phosphatase family protein [Caulobacter sp.]|nr:histidine phosphatase family protein [Vitreoscilla sp.]
MSEGPGDPPRLFLIRHGETAWTLTGQHTGRTDLALTSHGEDEARALAPSLNRIDFSHVLTSPLLRARETCVLTGLAPAARIEPDLAEWDYGDFEGLHSDDIRKQWPGWNVFRDGCPGGESAAEVSERADRIAEQIAALHGNVALFSHGQFSCSLAVRWIGLAIIEAHHFSLATASISVLGSNPNHPDIRVIARWNALLEQVVGPDRHADIREAVSTD